MTAGAYNFVCQQGDTFDETLELRQEAETGVLLNLTGYAARMQVRRDLGAEIAVELSTANGRIVLGGAAGTVQLLLTPALTAALDIDRQPCTGPGFPAVTNYLYDLELTDDNGRVTTVLRGFFAVTGEVTK